MADAETIDVALSSYDLGMKEDRFGNKTQQERMEIFREVPFVRIKRVALPNILRWQKLSRQN